jgi:F-type H+-transporting ATPase subunit b
LLSVIFLFINEQFRYKLENMENFNQIFTLLAEHEGIGLNLDILETGLLNILALLAILISTGRDFLGSLLEERKATIVKSVQDAEDRLNEAKKRLSEAEKQLSQANLVISEIKNETIATKKLLLQSDAYQAKKDLKIRFERALATFRSKERQIFIEIKQQIISLVLKRTVIRAKELFGPKERATALINDTINKLEGDLL